MEKMIITACLVLGLLSASTAGIKGKVDSGNSRYKKGDYEGALSKYQDAQIDEPENPVLHFNSGDALFKAEKYEEAMKEYEKASYSKDIEVQAKSYYNMGNSLYRSEKLPEAIQYYQKCLELDSNDRDAKYNIELARKKLKENIDKNKQQGQQGKDKKQEKSRDNKDDKKNNKEQKAQAEKEEKDKKDSKEPEGKKDKMSKEDAERLLKAINEDEKKALEKNKDRMQKTPGWGNVKEDW